MTSHDRIRGIALNDVGYDDINIKDGLRYSDYIGQKLKPNAYTTPKPLTTKMPDRNRARKKIFLVFFLCNLQHACAKVTRRLNFTLYLLLFQNYSLFPKLF